MKYFYTPPKLRKERFNSFSEILSPAALDSLRSWLQEVKAGKVPICDISDRFEAVINAVDEFQQGFINANKGFLTVPEAAAFCGVSANSLYIAYHRGRLPEGCFIKTGRRKGYRVNITLLYEYIVKSSHSHVFD